MQQTTAILTFSGGNIFIWELYIKSSKIVIFLFFIFQPYLLDNLKVSNESS